MLDEKELNNVSGENTEVDNNQYIDAIKSLKENTVERSKYEELKAENKRLLESIVNGEEINVEVPAQNSVQDLRNELFKENSGLSNLEYAEKALELREKLISEGKPDPFVPIGSQYTPTAEDEAAAQRVADVLKTCIDYAEGDNQIFTNELQRRMIDTKF